MIDYLYRSQGDYLQTAELNLSLFTLIKLPSEVELFSVLFLSMYQSTLNNCSITEFRDSIKKIIIIKNNRAIIVNSCRLESGIDRT